MAKLNPKDPQFGIPVASRINGELALRLNKEAQTAGKTLSRYLSEYIEKAVANENRTKELAKQLTNTQALTKKAVSRFIMEISKGDEKKATELVQTYNTILKDEKSK